jgi:hypothetical protein
VSVLAAYASQRAFYNANPVRDRSPEVDFGCHWHDAHRTWPNYRLSWVVLTGELILVRLGMGTAEGTVRVAAVVPQVGEYPFTAAMGDHTEWRKEQDVERVLDGWAEQGGDLSWLEARLAAHTTNAEVAA